MDGGVRAPDLFKPGQCCGAARARVIGDGLGDGRLWLSELRWLLCSDWSIKLGGDRTGSTGVKTSGRGRSPVTGIC